MPTYDYHCDNAACQAVDLMVSRLCHVEDRDGQLCEHCGDWLSRHLATPYFKANVGTADDFTADMLGIPKGELPSGLKT